MQIKKNMTTTRLARLLALYLVAFSLTVTGLLLRQERQETSYAEMQRTDDIRLVLALEARMHSLCENPSDNDAAAAGRAICSFGGTHLDAMGQLFSPERQMLACDWQRLHILCSAEAKKMLRGERNGRDCLALLEQVAEELLPAEREIKDSKDTNTIQALTPEEAMRTAAGYIGDTVRLLTAETTGNSYVFRCRNCCMLLSRTDGTLQYYADTFPRGKRVFSDEACLPLCLSFLEKARITVSLAPVDIFTAEEITTYVFQTEDGTCRITVTAAADTGDICYYNACSISKRDEKNSLSD